MLASCAEPDTAAHWCASYRLSSVGGWSCRRRDELAALYAGPKAGGAGQVGRGVAADVTSWTASQQTGDRASHTDVADSGSTSTTRVSAPRASDSCVLV